MLKCESCNYGQEAELLYKPDCAWHTVVDERGGKRKTFLEK